MKTYMQYLLTSALSLSLATATVLAQTGTRGQPEQRQPTAQQQPTRQGADTQVIIKGSDLVGFRVENQRGEDLGEVADVIINQQTGTIAYLLLSSGGVLGAAEQHYAVPIDKFELNADAQRAVLAIDRNRLQQMPTVDTRQALPAEAPAQWQDIPAAGAAAGNRGNGMLPTQRRRNNDQAQRNNQAQRNGNQVGAAAQQQPRYMVRASNLIGFSVRNRQGETLGNIEDLVVDPETGSIEYAVLSSGGFFGFGSNYYAVPLDKLHVQPGENTAILEVSRRQLEQMPAFDARSWPIAPDEQWNGVPNANGNN